MTDPLADRILEALGDARTQAIVRRLLEGPATQAELQASVGCDQGTVSRATAALRMLGLVAATGGKRSLTWAPVHRDELVAMILAADRLAEAVLRETAEQQSMRSSHSRRLAVRPAETHGPRGEQEA